jgi:hypothetical protein
VPEITMVGEDLVVEPGFTYQWYLDGVALVGETGNTLTPTEYGTYTVELINGTCSTVSDEFQLLSTGITVRSSNGLRVFPNPTDDRLTVEMENYRASTTLRLVDACGKAVLEQSMASERSVLDLGFLTAGTYVLFVEDGQGPKRYTTVVKR